MGCYLAFKKLMEINIFQQIYQESIFINSLRLIFKNSANQNKI